MLTGNAGQFSTELYLGSNLNKFFCQIRRTLNFTEKKKTYICSKFNLGYFFLQIASIRRHVFPRRILVDDEVNVLSELAGMVLWANLF